MLQLGNQVDAADSGNRIGKRAVVQERLRAGLVSLRCRLAGCNVSPRRAQHGRRQEHIVVRQRIFNALRRLAPLGLSRVADVPDDLGVGLGLYGSP